LKLCTGFDDAKVVILFVKREDDASFSVGTGRDHQHKQCASRMIRKAHCSYCI